MGVTVKGLTSTISLFEYFSEGIDDDIEDELMKVGFRFYDYLLQNSPVGKTGQFRAGWMPPETFASHGIIAGIEITNNKDHAGPVTYGSEQGKKPWPNAGPLTVAMSGRIYSKQAPGGLIESVIEETADEAAKSILEAIKI